MPRRKLIRVEVTLSVAAHVSAAVARKELRARANELCGWSEYLDESDVRIRSMKPLGRAARQPTKGT